MAVLSPAPRLVGVADRPEVHHLAVRERRERRAPRRGSGGAASASKQWPEREQHRDRNQR